MMFEMSFNLMEEGKAIRTAVEKSIEEGIMTEDLKKDNPSSTSKVGDWVAEYILKN